jgi:hypothetical protein
MDTSSILIGKFLQTPPRSSLRSGVLVDLVAIVAAVVEASLVVLVLMHIRNYLEIMLFLVVLILLILDRVVEQGIT